MSSKFQTGNINEVRAGVLAYSRKDRDEGLNPPRSQLSWTRIPAGAYQVPHPYHNQVELRRAKTR